MLTAAASDYLPYRKIETPGNFLPLPSYRENHYRNIANANYSNCFYLMIWRYATINFPVFAPKD